MDGLIRVKSGHSKIFFYSCKTLIVTIGYYMDGDYRVKKIGWLQSRTKRIKNWKFDKSSLQSRLQSATEEIRRWDKLAYVKL